MSANKHLVPDSSRLLKDKLDKLSAKLQGSLASDELQTQEAYLFEAIKVLQGFYKTLNDPQIETPEIRKDDLPDVELYQDLWNKLLDDLTIIFREIENVESLTVANFNFATTEGNRLTARLKAVSSKLGDYILYSLSPTKDAFFFKDSFNDLSKVDVNSALLNVSECEINQDEGIVTLPINRDEGSGITITETPIVDPSSNGAVGNNQELGAQFNGDIAVILDDNPDTWFEYERVVVGVLDTKEPLVLSLTINFGSEQVVNHIRVNPNNFGTKTTIRIDAIDTSIDGEVYTSIKDDIPIADFVTEDEENIFSLAPSTSKFAGQGLYTFTPRKIKYARFTFRQTEPYVIDTPSGERLRYAIGIRDIDIRAFTYKTPGEIVTVPFESLDEIRKVLLQSNQNPSELSELTSIEYFVSHDNGGTWHGISPKELEGTSGVLDFDVPEILEFNGPSANTINTPRPVNSLRLKAKLARKDEAFLEGSSTFKKTIGTRTEVHAAPSASPFILRLEKPPVDGTVVVIDPMFGSRGLPEAPYYLGNTIDRLNLRTFRLPFKNLPRPVKKVETGGKWHTEPVSSTEWMHLEIGGEEWTHATDALSTYGATDKVFIFNPNDGVLQFGNNTNGKAPEQNEPIAAWFDAEPLFPSETEDAHTAQLDFPTSNSKSDMKIKRYDKIVEVTDIVPRHATVIRLRHANITDTSGIESTSTFAGANKQTFLNGKDELTSAGDWSIDMTEGIIFAKDPTPGDQDITVSYKYQPIQILTDDEWEWADTKLLRDGVAIKEDQWKTLSVEGENVLMEDDVTVLDLSKLAMVRGTLTFDLVSGVDSVPSSVNPFIKEVPYIDGKQELGLAALQAKEQIPALSTGLNAFVFSEKITTDTNFSVTFSDTSVFVTDVSPATPSSNGEYKIDRSAGTFSVYTSSPVVNPGTVTYYYNNPNNSDNGLYSINYRLGRVHTQRPMNALWTLEVGFEYTDFRAEYRIARLLNRQHYDVDITNRAVVIKDGELLDRMLIPKTSLSSSLSPFYLVSYDYVIETREEIAELKNFFSPVIKDYALKILTKGRIF